MALKKKIAKQTKWAIVIAGGGAYNAASYPKRILVVFLSIQVHTP